MNAEFRRYDGEMHVVSQLNAYQETNHQELIRIFPGKKRVFVIDVDSREIKMLVHAKKLPDADADRSVEEVMSVPGCQIAAVVSRNDNPVAEAYARHGQELARNLADIKRFTHAKFISSGKKA